MDPALDLQALAARVEAILGRLLESSHALPPDDLPLLVDQELRRAGLDSPVIYLVDLEEESLTPLVGSGPTPIAIDGTMAGRCYQTENPLIGEGDRSLARAWIPMRDGVERLGVLQVDAPAFDETLVTSCEHVASLVAELLVAKLQYGDRLAQIRRSRPMTIAAELRWAALPPRAFATPHAYLAASLAPVYEVAGDAYDYALNGDILHLAVFDAMGHGLEAARMANLAIAVYRNARRRRLGLLDAHEQIDRLVGEEFGPHRFVTGQLAELNVASGLLRLTTAGHPGPLLLRNGHIAPQIPAARTLPWGLGPDEPEITELALEPDDRVVLLTDGIIEARSAAGDPFGEERLADTIERSFSEQYSPSEAVRRLMVSLFAHQGATLRDDASVLLVWWPRTLD